MNIDIRKAVLSDSIAIRRLCSITIRNSCKKDYSPEQLKVWISRVDRLNWATLVTDHYFLIAEMEDEVVGFGSIEEGEYIGYLYVSSKHLRKGIANRILEKLIKEADRLGRTLIWSNVSKTAKPFFVSNGFSVAQENINLLEGVEIENYRMIRNI